MGCNRFTNGDTTVIVCSRGTSKRRCQCGRVATILCDFPLSGAREGKTCDKPCCHACSVSRGKDHDYCRAHDEYARRNPTLPLGEPGTKGPSS
jgi:hypothetical protein